MGNPKKFTEQYFKYEKIFRDNMKRSTMEEERNYLISASVITSMMSSYVRLAAKKHGYLAFLDAFKDEYAKPESKASKNLKDSIKYLSEGVKDPALKEKITGAYDLHKDEPDALGLYNDMKKILFADDAIDEAKKFTEKFVKDFFITLAASPEKSLDSYDTLIKNMPPEEDTVEDEKKFLTSYDKELKSPLDDKIRELKKENENDPEFLSILDNARIFTTEVEDDNWLGSTMGEGMGKRGDAIMVSLEEEYKKEVPSSFTTRDVIHLRNANDLMEYLKSHPANDASPSMDYVNKMVDLTQYARKNHLVETDPREINPQFSRVDDVIAHDTENLIEAIRNKDKKDIKKYYEISKSKTEKLDYLMDELKKSDPLHLISANLSCSRTRFHPVKYRLDYEGVTLFNQLGLISDLSIKHDIEVKDLYQKPELAVSKIIRNDEKNSIYTKIFQKDDPFSVMEKIETSLRDEAGREGTMIGTDLSRYTDSISINNPMNRAKWHNHVLRETEIRKTAYSLNHDVLDKALRNPQKLYGEILPAMMIFGTNFNIHTMVEGEKPQIDIETMKIRAPFNLKEHIKNSVFPTTLVQKLREAADKAENYGKSQKYQSYIYSIDALGIMVKDVLKEKYHFDSKTADLLIDDAKGVTTLTRIQNNTINARLEFGECSLRGFRGKALLDELDTVALLKSQYDRHNIFAKIFYKNLRAQKASIDAMEKTLTDSGLDKKQVEKAIKDINSNHQTLAEGFVDSVSEREHLDIPEVKTNIVIDDAMENETDDKHLELFDKYLSDEDKEVIEEISEDEIIKDDDSKSL